jgi:hypothetical protein
MGVGEKKDPLVAQGSVFSGVLLFWSLTPPYDCYQGQKEQGNVKVEGMGIFFLDYALTRHRSPDVSKWFI